MVVVRLIIYLLYCFPIIIATTLVFGMTQFEALYGRRCKSPFGWFRVGEAESFGPNLVHQARKKVKVIRERLKVS